jgi:iron complex transport system permease protein
MHMARWLVLLAIVALASVAGILLGSVPLSLADVFASLRGQGTDPADTIVRALRLPRVAMAGLVGAGLGASGAALQGALRNPLAEPYLLGVSGGAAVGAVIAVASGVAGIWGVSAAAFAGAALAVILVIAVASGTGRRADPKVLLMAGVVVGAFANAAIMIVLTSAPAERVRDAVWWMMGSAAGARWSGVLALLAVVVIAVTALVASGRELDALALGEEPAAALGVNVERAGARIFLLAALLAAATVASAGLVGFVGLVVPHIARAVGVRGHRQLIAASALVGAAIVIVADIGARTVRAPLELPLGAVTAVVGVPFLLVQLRRMT